jgi:hypothetical protein
MITITGTGDHDQLEWVITTAGMRTHRLERWIRRAS